jgi:hypothetical protein
MSNVSANVQIADNWAKIVSKACADNVSLLLCLGRGFLILALVMAVIGSIIWCLEKFGWIGPKGENRVTSSAATFLDALKGLIEALTKAPPWYAAFLAGCLLIWAVIGQADKLCKPIAASPPPASIGNHS